MIDWKTLLYAPNYSILGVPAVLTLEGTDGETIELTAIDKTSPVTLGGRRERSSFAVEIDTVEPAATVRVTELAGRSPAELRGASLAMNGKTWIVRSHLMEPAPTGEADGEIRLILEEA